MNDEPSNPKFAPLSALDDDSSGGISFTPVMGSSGMTYRPILALGEGGMARVFLAHGAGPSGFRKLVVLKMMRRHHVSDAGSRQMFLAEARLSARLNHPNLVQVYEVHQAAEIPCLVMEYLDGKPLSALHAGEHITSAMLLSVICEALNGLHHAHELCDFHGTPLNIVHRDISPHNVFVTYDGAAKVLDFGIAKTATTASDTKTGEVKGKLTYMAPEQLLGDDIDRRADLFAVGSMLWDAALGLRMWDNVSEGVLMQRLVTGAIPKPSERTTIDPELEAIIVKATAPEPADRYATALELQHDLDRFLSRSGGRVPMREVGAALAETFKEERLQSAAAISRALRQSSPPGPSTPLALESPARERGTTIPVALTLGLLVAGGIALWQLVPAFDEASSTASASARPPASILITVRAEPADARVEIDGKAVGGAETSLSVTRDTREHVVRISAAGHSPETRSLRFDRSQSLHIRLPRLPAELETDVAPAPSNSAAPERRRSHAAARRVAPPPKAPVSSPSGSTSASAPAASEDNCSPPYYFAAGIKTYKPECL